MLDVDSKDPTVGISSPPKVFVQPEFLTKLASCVDNNGKQTLMILIQKFCQVHQGLNLAR